VGGSLRPLEVKKDKGERSKVKGQKNGRWEKMEVVKVRRCEKIDG